MLPQGVADYGEVPDDFQITKAIRMSTSIPGFYEPVKDKGNIFVDGGLLSNFPVWLFDSEGEPMWPMFGFRLVDEEEIQGGLVQEKPNRIKGIFDYVLALIYTLIEAHDKCYIRSSNFNRTILIPTLGIRTTDFDISKEEQMELFLSGAMAAVKFFKEWDFEKYKRKYRA